MNFVATQNEIKVILLDFDQTLTKMHTGGAQLFSNQNPLMCRCSQTNTDVQFAHNNAVGNAALIWSLIRKWIIEEEICVAIVTMADRDHANLLAELPFAKERAETHTAVGGEEMVWRWLNGIACDYIREKSDSPNCAQEMAAIESKVLESARLLVVAKFDSTSKFGHLRSALEIFSERSVLPENLRAENVLYIDDTLALLENMRKAVPKIRTMHAKNGLDLFALEALLKNQRAEEESSAPTAGV